MTATLPLPATVENGAQEELDPRRWRILFVLCLSLATVMIANSSLNTALPLMSERLGASTSDLQWIVDAYSLVFAGMLFAAGALGDRFGRKGALQVGLGIFVIGTLFGAVSHSASQVIGARALMGFGAAFVMPATLSIIVNVFPPSERARAIALWTAIAGAGGALGPIASGLLLEHYSWNSVFLVNVPVVALALVVGARILPTSRDHAATRIDVPGALLSIAGVGTLVYSIIEAPAHGWLSAETLLGFAVAAALLAAFGLWELRTAHPMLNLSWFTHRALSVGSTGIALLFFAMFGMMFLLTQYLQLVHGYSPLGAAVRMLPIVATMMAIAPRSPAAVARFGARRVVGTGLTVLTAGTLLLAQVDIHTSYAYLVGAMIVMVAGLSFSMAPLTNAIMSGVPRDRAGVGSAINDTTRELGGALGVAVLGSILTSQFTDGVREVTAGLPPALRSAARSSLAGSLQVAERMGSAGTDLAETARSAFVHGMGSAFMVGAVMAALSAAIAWRLMPDTVEDADHV